MSRGIHGLALWLPVAVLTALGTTYWGLNRTALDYGPAENSTLEPSVVRRGDVVHACFGTIKWYRTLPGVVEHWYECPYHDPQTKRVVLRRFDMQERIIKIPEKPGELPAKCRVIGNQNDVPYPVPNWCEPGELRYGGYARLRVFGDWWTLTYSLPGKMSAQIVP